jgi:hypothetical protein
MLSDKDPQQIYPQNIQAQKIVEAKNHITHMLSKLGEYKVPLALLIRDALLQNDSPEYVKAQAEAIINDMVPARDEDKRLRLGVVAASMIDEIKNMPERAQREFAQTKFFTDLQGQDTNFGGKPGRPGYISAKGDAKIIRSQPMFDPNEGKSKAELIEDAKAGIAHMIGTFGRYRAPLIHLIHEALTQNNSSEFVKAQAAVIINDMTRDDDSGWRETLKNSIDRVLDFMEDMPVRSRREFAKTSLFTEVQGKSTGFQGKVGRPGYISGRG